LVSGDFRQTEIKQKWQEVLNNENKKFTVDTVEVFVSGGFYVRQFVTDLAEHFLTGALTYHILRTKVGNFNI
jgi:tRNA U55 pseudouridine synthase TruB